MNRNLLICICAFMIMACVVSEAYACGQDPNAVLSVLYAAYYASQNTYFVPVGAEVDFDGASSYDPDGGTGPSWAGGIRKWEWDFGDNSSYYEDVDDIAGDGMLDGKTTHEYTTAGHYQLTFTVTDNDAAEGSPPDKTGTYICWITAVAVDLGIDGVSDDDEENPGGFVGVGDLTEISLSVSPTDRPGYAHLEVVGEYQSCVKIWDDESKTNLVIPDGGDYYKNWAPADMPTTLWVEGVAASVLRDPLLGLHYFTPDDQDVHGDAVNFTVVRVDVDADLSEEDELDPGKYINVNWDDDDEDGWQPNDAPPDGAYTGDKSDPNIDGGDNDLRPFIVSISPWYICQDFPNSKVSITFPSNVKVWQTNTKKRVLGDSSELTSGHEFKIENLPKQLYLEGYSGSSTFKDVELKATWLPCDFKDVVKVTVFEVELDGLFGFDSQQSDNDKKFSSWGASSDNCGKISWDDANADGTKGDMDANCEYFHNCMECQGTVKPSGVTNEVQFDIERDRWGRAWTKSEGGSWSSINDSTPWEPDTSLDEHKDLTPSTSAHIYDTDAPGLCEKARGDTVDYWAQIGDFRQWVIVSIDGNWYQCSDYYKWHTKLYTKPKDANYMTRDSLSLQELGEGWITVPGNP